MKQSKAVVSERRKKLMEIVQKTGDVRVPDIAQHLQVSEITVRRDLQYLEDRHVIERYYGGARVISEKATALRDRVSVAREMIARYAAEQVMDGETIFINTSSTALMAVRYITAKDVTIVTNNGNIVTSSHTPPHVTIILLGGDYTESPEQFLSYISDMMIGKSPEERPTAFIAGNDFMAAEVMKIIKSLGLRMPENVAVIGTDNTYLTTMLSPTLTSVDFSKEEFAKQLTDTMLALIRGEHCEDVYIHVNLSLKESA